MELNPTKKFFSSKYKMEITKSLSARAKLQKLSAFS